MQSKQNVNSIITEGRSLREKYDVYISRAGEVSAALRTLPGFSSLYEEVQHAEVLLHTTRKRWDAQYAAFIESREGEESIRRHLMTMARAAVAIGESSGISGLRDILVADANDEASIAARLAQDVKAVPMVGEALSTALSAVRQKLLAKEAAYQEVVSDFEAATRDFGEAYYRASASLAQGKAVLFANGIKVNDRKVVKRKKRATSSDAVPTPAPTLMPLAA